MRYRRSSALRTSCTSCSTGISAVLVHDANLFGKPASGRLNGITSGRIEANIRAACTRRPAVTSIAGWERIKLSIPNFLPHANHEIDRPVQHAQHRECDQENDPAFQAMEKSAGQLRIDVAQDSSDGDASRVGDDGYGDHAQQQGPAHPHFLV